MEIIATVQEIESRMKARAYCGMFAPETVPVARHGYRILQRNCCSRISSSKLRTLLIQRWGLSFHD